MKKSATDAGQWPIEAWNFVVFCYKIQQIPGFYFSTKATISPLTTLSPCFAQTATTRPSTAGTISSMP